MLGKSKAKNRRQGPRFDLLEPRLLLAADGVPTFPNGLTGDYDNSGQVSQGDLDLVLQNWGLDSEAQGVPANWVNDLPIGQIDQTELDRILQNWGQTVPPNGLTGDYNNSGQVEQGDLDLVLQNWGADFEALGIIEGWINDLPSGQIEQSELDGVLQNWGKRLITEDTRLLPEGQLYVNQFPVRIELGQSEGTRTVTVDLAAQFDISDTSSFEDDLFQVYLLDPLSSQTLLDGGLPGSPLFSWSESGTEFRSGQVTFDGTTLSIDVTGVAGVSQGDLVFRSLNRDLDNGSVLEVSNVTNTVDPEGVVPVALPAAAAAAPTGPALPNAGGLTGNAAVQVLLDRVAYDPLAGSYAGELSILNTGAAIGRDVAVFFDNLPDGVTLANASESVAGVPYVNLREVIPFGGLDTNGTSLPVELRISNPNNVRVQLQPQVRVGQANRAPALPAFPDVAVFPGDTRTIDLTTTDPDGDEVSYTVVPGGVLPTLRLRDGQLIVSPGPGELGTYTVTVRVSDGALSSEQSFDIDVVADPISTTRLSGRVMDSDGVTPLPGVPVALNGVETVTDAAGLFTLTVPSLSADDTLKVRGNDAAIAGAVYPFVAERVHLVLENGPFAGVNNVVTRPIYLPALDVVGGSVIDPNLPAGTIQNVTQALNPGETPAVVAVETGTLLMDDGNGVVPFDGVLSVTEVPRDLTPAALPEGLLIDVVVTIQPGEMIFTQPAPLTLPNRVGYAAGTTMDLWSINPITGVFEIVGQGVVSADGQRVETVSGGIRNSSWHGFALTNQETTVENPSGHNADCGCATGKDLPDNGETKKPTTSQVALRSGVLTETHDLPRYESLGVSRGLQLTYDSVRANPRPVVRFSQTVVDIITIDSEEDFDVFFTGRITSGSSSAGGAGGATRAVLDTGRKLWRLGGSGTQLLAGPGDRLTGGIQLDLQDHATGAIRLGITSGVIGQFRDSGVEFGGESSTTVEWAHVNTVDSPFGAGWGLTDWLSLTVGDDGVVLMVNGDGSEFIYRPNGTGGGALAYAGPTGDPGTFERFADGTYRYTATTRTTHDFDADGRLTRATDRNGNQTQYLYTGTRLTQMVDPAGLITQFRYTGDRVTEIEDPAGRITQLGYDTEGNLEEIINPDQTQRAWTYTDHLMTSEVDERGFTESVQYDGFGRVTVSTLGDGTQRTLVPIESSATYRPGAANGTRLPDVRATSAPGIGTAFLVDGNGVAEAFDLDAFGQIVSSSDAFGQTGSIERDNQNLPVLTEDGRGNKTHFEYDGRGNVTRIAEENVGGSGETGVTNNPSRWSVGNSPVDIATADLNGDGNADFVTADRLGGTVTVRLGNGDRTFQNPQTLVAGARPTAVLLEDFTRDGVPDLVVALDQTGLNTLFFVGNGDGSFAFEQSVAVNGATEVSAGHFNNDDMLDLAVLSGSSVVVPLLLGADDHFVAETAVSLGAGALGLRVHDLNNDGTSDLVVGSNQPGEVAVRLGAGDGTFLAEQRSGSFAGIRGITLGHFNADPDLDVAVTVGTNPGANEVWVLFGGGDGGFTSPVFLPSAQGVGGLASGDFNRDGHDDLVGLLGSNNGNSPTIREDVFVYLGDGDGGFSGQQRYQELTGNNAGGLGLADVNNDGNLDLLTTNPLSDDVSVLVGYPEGVLIAEYEFSNTGNLQSLATADLNDDGVPDVVTSAGQVLIGRGDLAFAPVVQLPVGNNPADVALADLNGDTFIDVVINNATDGNVSVVLGNGDGTFQAPNTFGAGSVPGSLAVGQLDADSFLDIVVTNAAGTTVTLLRGNGDGTFQAPEPIAAAGTPAEIRVVDLDSDLALDLVTVHRDSGTVVVNLNQGNGTFSALTPLSVGSLPQGLDVRDFNQDGVPDLAVAATGTDEVVAFLGNGDGTFAGENRYAVGDEPLSVAIGDLNADGLADLAVGNRFDASVSVLHGNGDGTFTPADVFSLPDGDPRAVRLADLNGDGRLDILTANVGSPGNGAVKIVPYLEYNTSPGSAERTFTYDPVFSQLTSATDELGRVTLYTVDPANGNRLSETRVIGEPDSPANGETDDLITSFTYTGQGLLDTVTDPLGRLTDYDYNALGRLTQITYAVGTTDQAVEFFGYDLAGNRTSYTDGNSNVTTFTYDDHNRLTVLTEPDPDGDAGSGGGPLESPVTRFFYNDTGNLVRTLDANGTETTTTFDARHRPLTVTDDLDQTTTFTYDNNGNLRATTDPLGQTTTNTYDGRDRLTRTTDPLGGVTDFRYDADNNLTRLTDPEGNLTRFAYDARDRLRTETDPLRNVIRYFYDPADNLTRKIDRNGRTTDFTYDDVDRLATETWLNPDGTPANQVDYAYDKASNLLNVADDFSSLTFTYDQRDRVQTVDTAGTPSPDGGDASAVLLTYTYDANGHTLSVTETLPGDVLGATTAYAYDALNRTTRITQAGPNTTDKRVDYTYNPLGQIATIERYGDLTGSNLAARTTNTYDALNRIEDLRHTNNAGGVINFFAFEFDADSRITALTDLDGRTDYTYDDTDQLTGADRAAGDARGDESYTYDDNGNRIASHRHGNGYVTGPANRLLSDGTYNYTYDDEGNQTRRTEIATGDYRTFTFDHRNRLTAVTDHTAAGVITQQVTYVYDTLGRRIARTADGNGNAPGGESTEHFIYNGQDVLLDFVDTDGAATSNSPELTSRYLFGPGIDQVLAQEDVETSKTLWLLSDHVGTVRDLINDTGASLNHVTYASFGKVIDQSDQSMSTRYLYSGRELDSETELYHYRSRSYDSAIGRFTSEDSLRHESGDSNLYRYVRNRVLLSIDPFGLEESAAGSGDSSASVGGVVGFIGTGPRSPQINTVLPPVVASVDVLEDVFCNPQTGEGCRSDAPPSSFGERCARRVENFFRNLFRDDDVQLPMRNPERRP